MAQREVETFEGTVVEVLPDTVVRVQLDNGGLVIAHISGKVRKTYSRVLTGDRVLVELSPHDRTRGRITAHLKA